MAKQKIEIEIELLCTCGNRLEIEVITDKDGNTELLVDVCPNCVQDAINEGRLQAYAEDSYED